MIAVANATPIISLASVEKLHLLESLFDRIHIAQAVYDEIKAKDGFGSQEIDSEGFQVHQIKGRSYLGFLLNDLDPGEAETILLAKELDANIVIIDQQYSRTGDISRILDFMFTHRNRGCTLKRNQKEEG